MKKRPGIGHFKSLQSKSSIVLTCPMLNKVLYDFKVAVEASGSEWRRVRLRRRVDVGPALGQQLDDLEVSGCGCAPQRWSALYRLAVECDRT